LALGRTNCSPRWGWRGDWRGSWLRSGAFGNARAHRCPCLQETATRSTPPARHVPRTNGRGLSSYASPCTSSEDTKLGYQLGKDWQVDFTHMSKLHYLLLTPLQDRWRHFPSPGKQQM
ncbi:hypothetical protein LEMLEM_LOCUS4733, partial [Lemmus lemmus]